MSTWKIPERALTASEWATLTAELGRPITDRPTGTHTAGQRRIDAERSAIVTNPDSDIAEQLSNLTAARKTAIKRQRRVRCGTEAGYQAHIARGEWACKLCTIAHETETA